MTLFSCSVERPSNAGTSVNDIANLRIRLQSFLASYEGCELTADDLLGELNKHAINDTEYYRRIHGVRLIIDSEDFNDIPNAEKLALLIANIANGCKGCDEYASRLNKGGRPVSKDSVDFIFNSFDPENAPIVYGQLWEKTPSATKDILNKMFAQRLHARHLMFGEVPPGTYSLCGIDPNILRFWDLDIQCFKATRENLSGKAGHTFPEAAPKFLAIKKIIESSATEEEKQRQLEKYYVTQLNRFVHPARQVLDRSRVFAGRLFAMLGANVGNAVQFTSQQFRGILVDPSIKGLMLEISLIDNGPKITFLPKLFNALVEVYSEQNHSVRFNRDSLQKVLTTFLGIYKKTLEASQGIDDESIAVFSLSQDKDSLRLLSCNHDMSFEIEESGGFLNVRVNTARPQQHSGVEAQFFGGGRDIGNNALAGIGRSLLLR